MYSGITSGRVLNGELLYTKILEVNLICLHLPTDCFVEISPHSTGHIAICPVCLHLPTDCFVEISPHSTGHIAICPVEWGEISMKQSVGKCKQINF